MDDVIEKSILTPLHALHLRLGARMVPFAGYEMPLQYAAGLLQEHGHTRRFAGLFDVSHMGQIVVTPRSDSMSDAALALETLIPIDILGLPCGRQRYGFLTNGSGGIRDDLMIANCGDHFMLVVNASCKADDESHLRAHLEDRCLIEVLPHALIALQGPAAESVLATLAPEVATMVFMDVRTVRILDVPCLISRSGYTGEDGFEISLPAKSVEALATGILADERVLPVGLGARDSLRVEAGLCLSGADMDGTTTPTQAGLDWAIGKVRRIGGSREGGFPGASRIFDEIADGVPKRRVGLLAEGRAPVRAGAALYTDATDSVPVGTVTSGGFGPTLGRPVAMGYLPPTLASPGTRVFAAVRGDRLPLIVTKMPLVPNGFKRDQPSP